MDMEWAKDGKTGELFIVQARPETVQSLKKPDTIEVYKLRSKGRVLASGRSVGEKIGRGPVRVIKKVQDLHQFRDGDVLVTDKTDPDWEPTMKKAAAIVTNRGGRTCHAAIVSRELGLPAVVGTERGTELLRDGQNVTVSGAEGDTGFVYEGLLDFDVQRQDLRECDRPENPDHDERRQSRRGVPTFLSAQRRRRPRPRGIHHLYLHQGPSDGLARLPVASTTRRSGPRSIALTAGYDDKPQFFVDKLAQGVGDDRRRVLSQGCHRPAVRLQDQRIRQPARRAAFEPTEENPMLGFRGALRYYDPRYRDGFALECRAMKKVRDEMGLTNVKLMVPFCRTVEEGKHVIAEMAKPG